MTKKQILASDILYMGTESGDFKNCSWEDKMTKAKELIDIYTNQALKEERENNYIDWKQFKSAFHDYYSLGDKTPEQLYEWIRGWFI